MINFIVALFVWLILPCVPVILLAKSVGKKLTDDEAWRVAGTIFVGAVIYCGLAFSKAPSLFSFEGAGNGAMMGFLMCLVWMFEFEEVQKSNGGREPNKCENT